MACSSCGKKRAAAKANRPSTSKPYSAVQRPSSPFGSPKIRLSGRGR